MIWYPTGAKHCEAHFKNDRLDGKWQKWDTAGNLLTEIDYHKGDIIWATPVKKTKPFEYRGELGEADFALILAQGSDRYGYKTLRVTASGRCDYRYYENETRVQTAEDPFHLTEVYHCFVWRKAECI